MKTQELTEKDIHCITRLLQSSIFADGVFYGCQHCKYWKNGCEQSYKNENGKMHYDNVMSKLQRITGLYMGIRDPANPEDRFLEKVTTR